MSLDYGLDTMTTNTFNCTTVGRVLDYDGADFHKRVDA